MRLNLATLGLILIGSSVLACETKKPGADALQRGGELVATKPEKALEQYERAAAEGAESLAVARGKAAALEELGKLAEAEKELLAVAAEGANDLAFRLALARIRIKTGRFDDARADLMTALDNRQLHVPSVLLLAAISKTEAQGRKVLGVLDSLKGEQYEKLRASAEFNAGRASALDAIGLNQQAREALRKNAQSPSMSPQLSRALAQSAKQVGKAWLAEWLLERASDNPSAPDDVHKDLAELALSQKHYSTAEKAIEKLRTGFRPDPEALLLQAQLFEAKKAPEKSVESTQRALDAVGADEATERRVALSHVRALLRAGRAQDATKAAEELRNKYPEYLPARLVLAGLYINGERPDAALELVTPLLDSKALIDEAHQLHVAALLLQKKNEEAKQAARQYVTLAKGSAKSIAVLAKALERVGEASNALKEIAAAEAKNPKNLSLIHLHVQLTEQTQGFQQAEATARRLAQRTKSPRVTRMLAQLYARHGRRKQAVETYESLLEAHPKNTRAWRELAQLYEDEGKLDKAMHAIGKALETAPSDTLMLLKLGNIMERKKDYEGAKIAYENVLAIEPNSPFALNNLSMLLSGPVQDTERAVELARQAHAAAPRNPAMEDTLGWALVQQGTAEGLKEAMGLLKHASRRLRTPATYYHYGAAAARAGYERQAKTALERALEGKTKQPWAADAQQLLAEVNEKIEAGNSRPSAPDPLDDEESEHAPAAPGATSHEPVAK